VEIDVVVVKAATDFEVIEIMGDKDPCPAMIGIDWAYEKYVIIDLKRYSMTFEADGIKVLQPLDPCLGPRYIEPMEHNMESDVLDQLYMIIEGERPDYKIPL